MARNLRAWLLRGGAVALIAGCSTSRPAVVPDAAALPEDAAGPSATGGSTGRADVGVDVAAVKVEIDAAADAAPEVERVDAAAVAQDFTCSELVGLGSTREWYQAGFEKLVVDARWQIRWHHRGYVEDWADAKNPYWGTYCDKEGCSRVSACAEGAEAPDRVVFVALNWIYTTEQQWEDDIRKDVQAIVTKYPGVRNIELISSSRCPDRCTTINPPGTMSELTAVQTCRTPAIVDEAIAAVAASHPGLVTVGPRFFTDDCDAFVSLHGPHLTPKGQKEIAAKVGAHYAAHP